MKVDIFLRNNSCLTVAVQNSTIESFAESLASTQVKGFTCYKGMSLCGDFIEIDDAYIRYTDIVHFRESREQ